MTDLATFLLYGLIGAAAFTGICVGGYTIQNRLGRSGIWIEERTRLSQIHFFAAGILLALVAIAVQYTVGWTAFAVLAAVAVIVSGMGERRVLNVERYSEAGRDGN